MLIGGSGDDYFFYDGESGADVILDFTAGAGTDDRIALDPSWFADFAEVLASTIDTAGGAMIVTPGGTILLSGVTRAQLHADDFLFCGCASAAAAAELAVVRTTFEEKDDASSPLVLPHDLGAADLGGGFDFIDVAAPRQPILVETWSDWHFIP